MSSRSRTGSPSKRPHRARLLTLALAGTLCCVLAAACIHDSSAPPAGYEDTVAEMDAQGLLRERQRLVEEMTFLEERIGELRAVQLARGPNDGDDAEGYESRAQRLRGLEQWRDLAVRKKAHVDAVLESGTFTRHTVRYKVNPQVLRAAPAPDGRAPDVRVTARRSWDELPAVESDGTADKAGNKAVVHRLSHETAGDTLRVRVEYEGQATARLLREDDPQAIVMEVSPVARPALPEGSVVVGPKPAPSAAPNAAPAVKAMQPMAPKPPTRKAMRPEAPPKATATAPTMAAPAAASGPLTVLGPPTVLGVEQGPAGKGYQARVRLDGQAAKYRYFTMDDPPRIVVDVYGVRPPTRTHRTIPVGEEQALRIRTGWHRGPDAARSKFRMVLDTSPSYLKAFRVVSDETGVAVVLP